MLSFFDWCLSFDLFEAVCYIGFIGLILYWESCFNLLLCAKKMKKETVWMFFIIIVVTWFLCVRSSDNERRLLKELFEVRAYNVAVRPVRYDNDTITVKIKHTMGQILDVDERKELFVTTGWNSLRWRDSYLSWDPQKFNGIKSVNLSPRMTWIPDIMLYDDFKSDKVFGSHVDEVQNRLTLNYKGDIIWGLKATFITKCHYDVYYFPFDIQSCHFRYGSWSYEKGRIDISPHSLMKTDYHSKHTGWHVIGHSSEMIHRNYTGGVYESAEFSVTFRRRAFFGLVNLILSPLIIGILALLSFMLPAASGERIALTTTLLLAMIFFIINVTHLVPNDNVTVPIIFLFFVSSLGEVVFLNICLIFAMQLYHKKAYDPPMPLWVRGIILGTLLYYVGMREYLEKKYFKHTDIESTIEIQIVTQQKNEMLKALGTPVCKIKTHRHLQLAEKISSREWRIAALVVDRCLFAIFTAIWAVTVLYFSLKITLEQWYHYS